MDQPSRRTFLVAEYLLLVLDTYGDVEHNGGNAVEIFHQLTDLPDTPSAKPTFVRALQYLQDTGKIAQEGTPPRVYRIALQSSVDLSDIKQRQDALLRELVTIEALEGRTGFTTFDQFQQAVLVSFQAITTQTTSETLVEPSVYLIKPRTILAHQEAIDPMTIDIILDSLRELGLVIKDMRYSPRSNRWRVQTKKRVDLTKLRRLYEEY